MENFDLSDARIHRFIFEKTADVIFVLDVNGRILTVNPALYGLMGFRRKEVVERDFTELVFQDEALPIPLARRLIEETIERVQQSGQAAEVLIDMRTSLEEPIRLRLRMERLETANGKSHLIVRAAHLPQDQISQYCVEERQAYAFPSHLITVEMISSRVTGLLERHTDPNRAYELRLGLREGLMNAIEHGNLEITFDEKTEATTAGRYRELILARQRDRRFMNRKVILKYVLDSDHVEFLIVDEGPGFDYEAMLKREIQETDYHGRGIALIRSAYDLVHYHGVGNRLRLLKFFD